ncbi:MAG: DNA polymerase III subunit delta' [Burkholderiales bacterium]|nr:DNA polymerase III subunit delta' [Burkholderiales bacterium]
MVVGDDGALPLPWLAAPLAAALEGPRSHRGHALLVQGDPGSGSLAFALTLAQAWLCERAGQGEREHLAGPRPCGRCGSCRLVQAHLHPDLVVLLPEMLRREHGWPLATDKPEGDEAKRKPSRQIRIDEVRLLIDWATRTSGRGRGKVAVLHPAEALNPQSANALLKTLEEPAPGTRLLLTCVDPEPLLPTVRSRCQRLRLAAPAPEVAERWLQAQGLAEPRVLLAACSGRPLDALALVQGGVDAAAWAALPAAVARGQPAAFAGWPLARLLQALQRLCHDAWLLSCGAEPRYFPPGSVPAGASPAGLQAWSAELARVQRVADHPWHEALLVEALVRSGADALSRPRPAARGGNTRFATLPA